VHEEGNVNIHYYNIHVKLQPIQSIDFIIVPRNVLYIIPRAQASHIGVSVDLITMCLVPYV
jgi:hypothetical protein